MCGNSRLTIIAAKEDITAESESAIESGILAVLLFNQRRTSIDNKRIESASTKSLGCGPKRFSSGFICSVCRMEYSERSQVSLCVVSQVE